MSQKRYDEAFKKKVASDTRSQQVVTKTYGVAPASVVAWKRKYRNKPSAPGLVARQNKKQEWQIKAVYAPAIAAEARDIELATLKADNAKLRAKLGEVLVSEFLKK